MAEKTFEIPEGSQVMDPVSSSAVIGMLRLNDTIKDMMDALKTILEVPFVTMIESAELVVTILEAEKLLGDKKKLETLIPVFRLMAEIKERYGESLLSAARAHGNAAKEAELEAHPLGNLIKALQDSKGDTADENNPFRKFIRNMDGGVGE